MSGFFKLNLADALKGFVVAVLGAGVTTLQQVFTVEGGISAVNWKMVLNVGIAAGIAYIVKNLLSTDTGAVLGLQATAAKPKV